MGTVEILIVFSALMALIALVTIGIDWIGKPLKNRRFIPRMYRFDDEKLPVDAYGYPVFGHDRSEPEPQLARQSPRLSSSPQASPRPVAHVNTAAAPFAQAAAGSASGSHTKTAFSQAAATASASGSHTKTAFSQAAATASAPGSHTKTAFSQAAATASAPGSHTKTAFSDSVTPPVATASSPERDTIAGTAVVPVIAAAASWAPAMALDTPVDGRKPSLAAKAERFWITTAATLSSSHFDDEDLARMAAGKAPRRTNPRTGKAEAMQLTGLRRASAHTDVRMRWPDDSVDPWDAS